MNRVNDEARRFLCIKHVKGARGKNLPPATRIGRVPKQRRASREHSTIPSNVFEAFERLTLEAIAEGRRRLSAKFLIELLRWRSAVRQPNSPFKIDNSLAPLLARLFAKKHPEHAGVFEMRRGRRIT